ncbi:hypothetical protein C8039_18970 [Halogeometricum sp. wsp3]|nr:hypothetical protein C8039_18970 [Halogeometricum sp. wsp3]
MPQFARHLAPVRDHVDSLPTDQIIQQTLDIGTWPTPGEAVPPNAQDAEPELKALRRRRPTVAGWPADVAIIARDVGSLLALDKKSLSRSMVRKGTPCVARAGTPSCPRISALA